MNILQLVGIGITSTILSTLVKKKTPEMSILIGIAGSIVIVMYLIPGLIYLKDMFGVIGSYVGEDGMYLTILFKIIGISYITEFASSICVDSGENAIGNKIELGGKVLILVVSSPVILRLMDLILELL